ncbi:unnamed protein product [Cylicocyclus nassatus]|uniref:Defensin n=1 Tax=Cylicocyclus nassatus TaxID=53992 RepID=A0AA36MFT7_CYLNA|nr:unnamed protein product [Cylicocyclus nassatus]
MMRHFVAFALLLIVLEISVEASRMPPCFFGKDFGCRARCLKVSGCQKGYCEEKWRCVCEGCPGGQQKKISSSTEIHV